MLKSFRQRIVLRRLMCGCMLAALVFLANHERNASFGQPPLPPRAEMVPSPAAAAPQTGWPAERQWVEVQSAPPAYGGQTFYGPAPHHGPAIAPWKVPMGTAGWHGPPGAAPPGFVAQPQFPQGEYVERERIVHTPSYRLRP